MGLTFQEPVMETIIDVIDSLSKGDFNKTTKSLALLASKFSDGQKRTESKEAHSAKSTRMSAKEQRSVLRSKSERNENYKAEEYKLEPLKDNPQIPLGLSA